MLKGQSLHAKISPPILPEAQDNLMSYFNILVTFDGDLRMSARVKFPDCYMRGWVTNIKVSGLEDIEDLIREF